MRIMLDTNVLISGFAFHSQNLMEMMRWIGEAHQLVLSTYVIDELKDVIARKAPRLQGALDAFLMRLPYELCYTPERIPDRLPFEIRDPDDIAVLYSAVIAEADVLITGDKDFAEISIEKPEILTPSEFMAKYH
ncbi:MAG: putative toxin-antitoxin system toxin component, PIN family [Clostridia bacterium]|nr:putative toxin-antitoxin system toxin component, PIN family [Clostridia bacterium]MBR3273713.1 putative toxin-antitoxin system toxin component, PIN family [Clostridia bacterium]